MSCTRRKQIPSGVEGAEKNGLRGGRKGDQKMISEMVKRFLQSEQKSVKSYLPNPFLEHRIVFKKGAVEVVKKAKGWTTDAEMARNLGITRQYMNMLHRTRVGVTSTVITRLAACMGNTAHNWWVYFDVVPYGVTDLEHPTWNQEKNMGQQPYRKCSDIAVNCGKTLYPSCEQREKF